MSRATMSLERYISHSMNSVPGFVRSLDAQVIQELLLHQQYGGIQGHLCEIGVHHGRLFFMLALARQRGERALAIDLFEDDAKNAETPHAGRNGALLKHAQRLGIELSPQEVFRTSSLDIEAADILARTTGGIRFFSIDGGHLYQHVAHDLRLAQQTLTADGVISVDDFFNIGWTDVSFATYDFLRSTDSVVPFAVTPTKMFMAPAKAAARYREHLRSRPGIGRASLVQILTNEVLNLRDSTLKKGYELVRGAVTGG